MGKKAKRGIFLGILAAAALLLTGGAFYGAGQTKLSVACYILDQSGGCSVTDHPCNVSREEQRYRSQLTEALRDNGLMEEVDLQVYNILYSFYRQQLAEALQIEEMPTEMTYPVMFVGDTVLLGTEEIERRLLPEIRRQTSPAARLRRLFEKEKGVSLGSETIDGFLYFTMEGCPDCAESEAYLDEKNKETDGALYRRLERYEVGESYSGSWEMLKKCYILYGREQESLWVPTVLAGDRCLIGMEEIAAYFDSYPWEKERIQTMVPEGYGQSGAE